MRMRQIPEVSLEQWAAFKAVFDEGGFAQAADKLNKSQSSVSYLLTKLNERLPTPAFELVGRKAELTELGKVLHRQAGALLEQALAIDDVISYFDAGWESEVVIAADALTPMHHLFCCLQDFSKQTPYTRVKILETSLSGTDEALLERRAHLAIAAHVPVGFLGHALWRIRMVPVVAKAHPLARVEDVAESELKQYRQIVVRDSGTRRSRDAGWLAAEQRWTVSHFSSSVEAVKAGLGFAFLPYHCIESYLEQGQLKRIDIDGQSEREIVMHLVLGAQEAKGPAMRALSDILKSKSFSPWR